MADSGVLTPKQTALLLGLMRGEKIEAAARTANISCRTATRFQKLPAFQAAMKEAQDETFERQLLILKQGMGAALATLARNMNEKAPPGVQVRSAAIWLEHSIMLHKIDEIEQQLTELQSLLKQGGGYE